MNQHSAASRVRLLTIFGTVLYVDEASGELRHGAIDGSPANVMLAGDRPSPTGSRSGWLMHDAPGAPKPIVCSPERSWSGGFTRPTGESRAPTMFECTPGERGLVGLRADGLYLCAEIDGRVTHSRRECGPWEWFHPVDQAIGAAGVAELPMPDTLPIFPGAGATRYHLGCGPNLIPGYLNIDQVADVATGRVFADFRGVQGAYFVNYDLSEGIPGRDNSLAVIYHCHFLEHLAFVDGIKLLQLARLRLKPGGMMRVVVPDLELWIDNYRQNNTAFFADYRRAALGDNAALYRTKGAIFMAMLHNFGHRCGYDFETLHWLLQEIGFTNIRRTGFQEGRLPNLPTIEPNWALRAMESLCVECEKPRAASAHPAEAHVATG
jgi:hypothetical protein